MYSKSKKIIKSHEEKIGLISNENSRIFNKLSKIDNDFEIFKYLHNLQIKERNLLFHEMSKKLINLRKKEKLLTEENKLFRATTDNLQNSSPGRSQHVTRKVRYFFSYFIYFFLPISSKCY